MLVPQLLRTVLVAVTAIALVGLSPTPGGAAEVEPSAGFVDAPETAPGGWRGPLTVGWLNYDVSQHFVVAVTGPGYSFERRLWIPEATSVRRRVAIDPLPTAGDYRATFSDRTGTVVFTHDLRAVAPVELRVAPVGPATFLPLVRDGVKDATRVDFSVDRTASVTAQVLDAAGRVVHRDDLGEREPGVAHGWTWSGAVRGVDLDRGRYTLRLLASADGTVSQHDSVVRVASYRVPVHRAVRRLGVQTATRTPGACRLSPRAHRALEIDCRGASRRDAGARVTWRFHPGTSADRLRSDVTAAGAGVQVSRRRAGGALLVTVRVRPGATVTVPRVRASYRLHQQR